MEHPKPQHPGEAAAHLGDRRDTGTAARKRDRSRDPASSDLTVQRWAVHPAPCRQCRAALAFPQQHTTALLASRFCKGRGGAAGGVRARNAWDYGGGLHGPHLPGTEKRGWGPATGNGTACFSCFMSVEAEKKTCNIIGMSHNSCNQFSIAGNLNRVSLLAMINDAKITSLGPAYLFICPMSP